MTNTVKMMEKAECTYMMPSAEGDNYREETVIKHLWKCKFCGFVWQSKKDAEECEHEGFYIRVYGGYYENNVHKGGSQFRISAVRKEAPECEADCTECPRFGKCAPQGVVA